MEHGVHIWEGHPSCSPGWEYLGVPGSIGVSMIGCLDLGPSPRRCCFQLFLTVALGKSKQWKGGQVEGGHGS